MLKVHKESTVEEAITSLMEKMPHYLQHILVQRKQAKFFQEKVQNLKAKEAVIKILQRTTLAFNKTRFKQPTGVKTK